MSHPFDLDLETLKTLDLDYEETLDQEESAQVGGATRYGITRRRGEQGGDCLPRPRPRPKPPVMTTLALGEEGGHCPPIGTTKALGEEGGWQPPEVTTMAIGEEGGDLTQ